MTHLIDKATLVAEIKRRITAYQKNFDKADNKIARLSTDGRIAGLKDLLSFIDALEVKEVKLDLEIDLWIRNLHSVPNFEELDKFARHFFELGIKTQKGEEV